MPGVTTGQVFTLEELELLEEGLVEAELDQFPEYVNVLEKVRGYRAELEACRVPS